MGMMFIPIYQISTVIHISVDIGPFDGNYRTHNSVDNVKVPCL